jgi:cysteinyl-tRNA synthetase
MELQVYNTLTKNKEKFIPNQAGQVKMYVCGPTVYDFLHIGNFRGPIFFNLVRNWLSASGYQVTYVYNYTDVDDKIIQRANHVFLARAFLQRHERGLRQLRPAARTRATAQRDTHHDHSGHQTGQRAGKSRISGHGRSFCALRGLFQPSRNGNGRQNPCFRAIAKKGEDTVSADRLRGAPASVISGQSRKETALDQ